MDAAQLFEAGQLDEAIRQQLQQVKEKPADVGRRTFLFELLCFAGDLDRAQQHLDVISKQGMQSDAAAQIYKNILQAERTRRRLYSEGLRPLFLSEPPPGVQHALDAVNRLREKDFAAALAALDAAEESRPSRPGKLNDEPFDDFRDCDDVLASVIELYVGTDYFWIPLQQVNSLEFTKPQHPRDLLWTACTIELTDGNVQRGFYPVLYHGTHQHEDPQVRLGRMTDWKEIQGGPVLGIGQRMFIAGEDAKAMLDVRGVSFDAPLPASD